MESHDAALWNSYPILKIWPYTLNSLNKHCSIQQLKLLDVNASETVGIEEGNELI